MIPVYFVILDWLPYDAGGNIQSELLPLPEWPGDKDYSPPVTEIQRRLVDTWAELLGVDREKVGIYSNFFEFGGRLEIIPQAVERINHGFQVSIGPEDFFCLPTVCEMAEYLEGKRQRAG